MTSNQSKLRAIIKERGLKRREIAELLNVSIPAVNSWLSPANNKMHREMPDRMIEFLELKLKLS
jgi:predicted transcriptional regulator